MNQGNDFQIAHEQDMDAYQRVTTFLLNFGYPLKVSGHRYVKEAIVLVYQNGAGIGNKSLYSFIANKHNTSPENAERCIRTLIKIWWRNGVCNKWFPIRPTNREFIIRCAELLSIGVQPVKAIETKIQNVEESASVYNLLYK